MSFWCRLFGHKIERIEHGAGVAEFCSRMNCDHYKYERRRPLRFGSPDDFEPISPGGAAPDVIGSINVVSVGPLTDAYTKPWTGAEE